MTAHDIAIYKPCAVIDRAYKEAYAKWFQIDVKHAQLTGQFLQTF